VLCPGRTLLEVHAAMGVPRVLLRHLPIGLPHIDAILASPLPAPPDAPAWTPALPSPLRLVYLGSAKPNKGLAALAHAVASISPDIARRLTIAVHAPGDMAPFRLTAGVNADCLACAGGYSPADLPSLLRGAHAGIFPNQGLENCPLTLLEFLAAGMPVLASGLGASADWIRHGENGWLVAPGDAAALAAAMTGIVTGATPLPPASHVRDSCGVPSFDRFVGDCEHALIRASDPEARASASP
jgi:glycosyltransferase involved in cell wall biosynthesis